VPERRPDRIERAAVSGDQLQRQLVCQSRRASRRCRQEGALADLLVVDGNPLDNLALVGDPGRNFNLIMNDWKIYKNTLH
jgi:hypothetical protein